MSKSPSSFEDDEVKKLNVLLKMFDMKSYCVILQADEPNPYEDRQYYFQVNYPVRKYEPAWVNGNITYLSLVGYNNQAESFWDLEDLTKRVHSLIKEFQARG